MNSTTAVANWPKRFRKIWRLLTESPPVFRRVSPRAVFALLWKCLCDGGGLRQFFLWLRDISAYEQRRNAARYQRWLNEFHSESNLNSDGRKTLDVLEIQSAVDHVDRSSWPVDQLISRISATSVEFLLLRHKNAGISQQVLARLQQTATETSADVVYADEDQLSDLGRSAPKFKPGFSIDLLWEEDYIGPVFLLRRTALERVLTQLPEEQADVSSYEILLRLAENDAKIERISEMVSWAVPREARLSDSESQSLKDHLLRRYGNDLGSALAGVPVRLNHPSALVSIVIPTRDKIDLLAKCLHSIYRIKDGSPFEVIVVNNGSVEPESIQWLKDAPRKFEDLSVIDADFPFNWSKLNNIGAEAASGEVLLFLNNDIEVLSEDWLDRMLVHALRSDVGVVGPQLLYPSGMIQHAGVVVGIGGFADHIYSGCPSIADDGHIFVDPSLARNVLACTGACMMLTKAKFIQVGCFNERLAICGDIDISVELHNLGYVNRYDPHVKLVHYESATRSRSPLSQSEQQQARLTLQKYLDQGDPYYNPNLALDSRYPTYSVP